MRVTYVLAAVLLMTALIFGVMKLLGQGRPPVAPNIIREAKRTTNSSLKIARQGPYPKVVVDTEFDFGRMEVGDSQSHAFTFRNEGEVPLVIENGGTTCQCTVSDMKLGETHEIAPGQSFDVKLTWKPEAQAEKFSKGADFYINVPDESGDPKKISLRVLGMVAPRIVIYPEKEWFLSNVTDEKPAVFVGAVMSPVVDHFQIVSVESPSQLLSFEVTPAEQEKLLAHQGLCGYEVHVTVKPEMPLGAFRFPLTIKTDLPGRESDGGSKENLEFEILLSGTHRGPIQPIAPEWIDEKMAISLRAFEAAVGKKVKLRLFVKSVPEDGLRLTA